MTATTMHFGPEWMRPKHSSRPQNPPSPPPTISQASPGMYSYSSLVTPNSNTPQDKPDIVNPFRYSKEDLLRIYKERGGQSGLGLEVERWEGVVREVGNDPIAMKEWDEAEKKLFAGPLNSEVRRRQSSDYLSSPLGAQSAERNKLMREQSGTGSPMRERFGNLIGRRREGSDQPPLTVPRKLSLSTTQNAINSSRDGGLSSPRSRGPLTPGFDGVLNAGESWTARRKRSESGSKTGTYSRGDGESESYDKGHEIREEEDEHSTDDGRGQKPGIGNTLPSGVTAAMDNVSLKDGAHQNNNDVLVAGTLASGQNPGTAAGGQPGQLPDVPHPPPGITDLASVEWSYLDPQGQIQGPFRADIMQKWYDGGYFSADLLMKRTHLDHDWTCVGELARRATGEKLFLSPIVRDQAPPGLPRPSESLLDGGVAASGFTAPYQPVPLRSIHTAALDSYFASGSTASNSPSSSFGVGRFAESPDPAALAGRVGGHIFPVNGSPGGSRNGSFVAEPSAFSVPRRAGFNDSPYDAFAVRSGFSNAPAVGTPSIDGFGLGSQTHPSHNVWPAASGLHNGTGGRADSIDSTGPFTPSTIPGLDATFVSQAAISRGFANGRPQNDGYGGPVGNIGAVNQRDLSRLGTRDPFLHEEKRDHPGGTVLGEYTTGLQNQSPYATPALSQTYSQSPSMHYSSPQAPAQVPPIVTSLGPSSGQPTTHAKQPVAQQPISATQSPWGANDENVPRRPAAGPGPFDQNAFPTASNTTSARTAPPQSSSWARTTQGSVPASVVDEQSPWHIASQSTADDGWGPPPNSLTVDNLGQHNQQQEREEALHKRHEEPSPLESTEPVVEQAPPEAAPILPTPDATPPATSKARRPSTARLAPTPITAPSPPQEAKSPSTASSTVPAKPVWSTAAVEEEKKTTIATPSLREIQEAETKKQEARKAAERERERAARASQGAAPTPTEEAQPFTASWGLPTSKVGSSRSVSIPTVKESATSTPATSVAATSPAPVWTNGNKPHAAKKTMKEIQEEEEKRKKLAAKDTVAAAAARRAYAETTTKSPQPSQAAGSAWTTVGSNGKLSTPAATTPVRPAVTPSVSAAAVTPVRPTTATPAVRPVVAAAVKAAPVAAKVEETPIAPSTDFMKWLTDSLKGLNNSVNFEEIMSMLLTFPLDVDSTTKEIISELIYANSTTLDGRRFAEEFVSKRKADAASRKGAGKQPSIADVLKAQPKPSQQSEWGGFKVVNKKKKGGRA